MGTVNQQSRVSIEHGPPQLLLVVLFFGPAKEIDHSMAALPCRKQKEGRRERIPVLRFAPVLGPPPLLDEQIPGLLPPLQPDLPRSLTDSHNSLPEGHRHPSPRYPQSRRPDRAMPAMYPAALATFRQPSTMIRRSYDRAIHSLTERRAEDFLTLHRTWQSRPDSHIPTTRTLREFQEPLNITALQSGFGEPHSDPFDYIFLPKLLRTDGLPHACPRARSIRSSTTLSSNHCEPKNRPSWRAMTIAAS